MIKAYPCCEHDHIRLCHLCSQDRFPPNIYYKIFTHRPIQDLGANAPRNYTSVREKKGPMASVHNKSAGKPSNYTMLYLAWRVAMAMRYCNVYPGYMTQFPGVSRSRLCFLIADERQTIERSRPSDPVDQSEGWYRRIENNGWRLVSDRLLHHAMNDPVTWNSANKPVNFKHTKVSTRSG